MGLFLRIITFGWASAISLAPFGVYVKDKYMDVPYVINEEKIHWYQQWELWFIGFYLWYFVEWIFRVLTHPRTAYRDISFEVEAKVFRFDYLYTLTRPKFASFKYIK